MNTDAVADLMREVADHVITPRFRSLDADQVMEKNPGDLVTVADQEAERLITAALLKDDPELLVVGEEATALDAGLPGRLPHAERAFTVDPVDGTKNFVHGSPDFAVMLSELHHGEVVRAWILHPAHEAFFIAERGAGVERDGRALPPTTTPHHLTVVTSSPRLEGTHGSLDLGPTAWSCGIDYPWLLEGRVHGLLYTRGLPWDHCPGSLMVRELGGVVAHLDGTPYDVGADRGRIGLLAASSQEAWDRIAPEVAHLYRG
ncbi:inositol monophosphatase family protein [Mobilicoccus sp.]|uniref:inositol monophosphatase family protein n=1 Tax=Mobilicoccus sp. TaxID=2034349 RepID=UPI0028B21EB1|nr:inositol monophosphatase family protein [Mobilicoccus sp.]